MTAIIDPTRLSTQQDGGQGASHAVQKVTDLSGCRVALVENTKRNAAEILSSIGEQLSVDVAVERTAYTKHEFAQPLSDEMLDELEGSNDVILVGVGDCGSCSAAAIADGIALEARGMPVVVIVTDAFESTARAMADMLGRGDFDFLVMPHPIANLTANEIVTRAADLVDPVRGRLVESPANLVAL